MSLTQNESQEVIEIVVKRADNSSENSKRQKIRKLTGAGDGIRTHDVLLGIKFPVS